ncbi:AraC family transcriptional regulator [Rodentibacter trehalosifermentans]|uniref:AraC family transcriptional regulator n=1 Tax=Rodentibacter trehalosifermentans TaxID=1908263 RepID=A0A1V3IUD5_9PAST|nr:AraC family transcriptional regulator [Rodentibacter trehalosifermentans]OOF45901.1 AraC family transcriptional regulator [Rodentibacter trehalosifermentans]OOF52954.1 AraC family transcriptional regulator [Rodentibacter trehalosifermentans]
MFSSSFIQRVLNVIPHNTNYISPIEGLIIRHSDRPFSYVGIIQEPSICIVLSGERFIQLGDQCYQFNSQHYMFCPVNVPMCGEIKKATVNEPFLVMSMKINITTVQKILLKQTALSIPKYDHKDSFGNRILDEDLKQAFERLLLLHENPKDINFLAPLIQQEIYYRLLTGEQGQKLKQMASIDSNMHKIAQATTYLRQHYQESVTIDSLATLCGMSVSGFHSHFKKITTMSPLQYQKSLRLMEAKRLIVQENRLASEAAFEVGYESASQFSREYKRMFGCCPKNDVRDGKSMRK